MEKALVCQRVANRLFDTERSIDAAMAETAATMTSLVEARVQLGLSSVVADDATNKLAQAIATLSQARSAVVAAHNELNDVKLRIGVRTKLIGVTDKIPTVTAEAGDLRRAG